MRELKFRAWDREKKRMIKSVWEVGFGTQEDTESWLVGDDNHIKNFELMQYVGFKDITGKEVYEGDIIKFNNGSSTNPKWSSPVSIVWREERARFDFHFKYEDNWSFNGLIYRDYEVIGNIYENQELL